MPSTIASIKKIIKTLYKLDLLINLLSFISEQTRLHKQTEEIPLFIREKDFSTNNNSIKLSYDTRIIKNYREVLVKLF